MKRIVSISLGSSKRDHKVQTEIMGNYFSIERIGTDGDMNKAIALLKELDGKVDAFGMGGIDMYIYIGKKRYSIKDAMILKNTPKRTPIVDGSGLKNTLERRVIQYLSEHKVVNFQNKNILLVSAADRFGMAEALETAGGKLVCGDLIFALGIPYPITSLKLFYRIANIIAPIAVKLPFHMIYPTGTQQNVRYEDKYDQFYHDAHIIAGDYHYIKKYMPQKIAGKIIITNTVTVQDIEEMKDKGASLLVTTTPELNGRSFGTNVLEAVFVSLLKKEISSITEQDYFYLLDKIQLKPRIVDLQSHRGQEAAD